MGITYDLLLKHLETNHQIQKLSSPKCVAVLDLVGQNFEAAQADSHQKCRDQGENHIPSSEQDMGPPPMGLHHQKLGFHWILAMKTIEKDTEEIKWIVNPTIMKKMWLIVDEPVLKTDKNMRPHSD